MFLIALAGVRVTLVMASGWLVAHTFARRSAEAQRRTWAAAFLVAALVPVASPFVPALDLPVLPARMAASAAARPSDVLTTEEGGPAVASRVASPSESRAVTERRPLGAGGLLATVWLLGTLVGLARLLAGLLERHRLVANARPANEAWRRTWRSLDARAAREPHPHLLETSEIEVPQTWGVLRPVIVVPTGSASWPEERRAVVLLHELLHLRRRDPVLLLWAHTVCILHWFNPVVWLAYRRFRLSIEKACDDAVLSESISPEGYAGHLVELARTLSGRPTVAAAIGFTTRRELEGRIRAILDPRNRRTCGRARTVVLACSSLVMALLVGAARPVPSSMIVLEGPAGFRWIEADHLQDLYVVDVALQGQVMLSGDSSRVVGVGAEGRLRITKHRSDHTPVYEAALTGGPRAVVWTELDPDGDARPVSRRTLERIREDLPAVIRTWAWSVAERRRREGPSGQASEGVGHEGEMNKQGERFRTVFEAMVGEPVVRRLDELEVGRGWNVTRPAWSRQVAEELWTKLSISIAPDSITVATEEGPFADALVPLFLSQLDRAGIALSDNDLLDIEEVIRTAGSEFQSAWESEMNASWKGDGG